MLRNVPVVSVLPAPGLDLTVLSSALVIPLPATRRATRWSVRPAHRRHPTPRSLGSSLARRPLRRPRARGPRRPRRPASPQARRTPQRRRPRHSDVDVLSRAVTEVVDRGESDLRSRRVVRSRDDLRRGLRAPTVRAAQRARPCQLTVPQPRADERRSRRDGVGGSRTSASRGRAHLAIGARRSTGTSATSGSCGRKVTSACRHRRSHNPRPGGPATRCPPCPLTARTAPPATGRRVSSADPRRQKPTVTGTTPRLDDGEQRLTALWEHDLDDAAADPKTADDAIAALFSSSPDGEAHTSPRETTGRTRRSAPRPGSQRAQARSRRRRAHLPHRLPEVSAARSRGRLAVAFALLIVAPDWFGEHPDSVATKARPQAGHAATAVARRRPAEPERKVRDSRTVPSAPPAPRHPASTGSRAPETQALAICATRSGLATPPPSRSTTVRPLAEPTPPHAREVPSAAATSSACDEFPPC